MGMIALYATVALARGVHRYLPWCARALALFLVAQAVSGTALGILAPAFSLLHFCANVGVYLAAFVAVESLIFAALRKHTIPAPKHEVRLAIGAYVAAFFFVVVIQTTLY